MEEVDANIVDDNDVSYGKSNKGLEVMILYDSEIFHKRKIGKRTLNNIFTISWNTDGSDYNVTRVQIEGILNCVLSIELML